MRERHDIDIIQRLERISDTSNSFLEPNHTFGASILECLSFFVPHISSPNAQVVRGGGRKFPTGVTLLTRELKRGYQGTINAKISEK